ncbi:hypothetical protein QL285_033953 [Trifolium repens]|nr:hypothetical protein QL285_059911 [Trifolium repens]KAK2413625.1 hypothetical protein QL285_036316 [Trifolium repens]KAK2423503.1 hypothetical protein QL285_033953 [Trifolium repens]
MDGWDSQTSQYLIKASGIKNMEENEDGEQLQDKMEENEDEEQLQDKIEENEDGEQLQEKRLLLLTNLRKKEHSMPWTFF